MTINQKQAPGQPEIPARWTSSAKSGVGTALNPASRVWFTLSHGIFDEIYYPRVDQACTRDMGFIVTNGSEYFSEEKRDAQHKVEYLAPGVPAYHLTNTCNQGRYRIEKEIFSDPNRDVVLQRTRFQPLKGSLEDYHLYVLLAPHLGNQGEGNNAWIGEYKGVPMLLGERGSASLALACSAPWLKRSAGFVGVSDGWQDINQHKKMAWEYLQAMDGNVALVGEIDLMACGGNFDLALGFGLNSAEAGLRAYSSLLENVETILQNYIQEWKTWQRKIVPTEKYDQSREDVDILRVSAAVLKTHEAKRFLGGLIASLAIPWGFSKGDDDLGGYHLVWPRDLAESSGGLLAIGALDEACRVIHYLRVTQEADGSWPQNMWLDGRPYWGGVQMDETAFPILLVEIARREGALKDSDIADFWPMVKRAASFLVRNGPVTQQDRWEEDPGFSPFTLAVEVAALLIAADLSDSQNEPEIARYLRETADIWNDNIERWTYVSGTELAKNHGVEGYYVRIAPPEEADAASPAKGFVPIKNRPPGQSNKPASQIVSPDALALVRFGLRAPHDPRILNTIKVIDELLKVQTPNGPAWHRYNDDGYGEHEDGSPFDGTGIGRAWPLLTGERAHYELAAGHKKEAQRLLCALEAFANPGGMIPEQIWDSEDIPDLELFCGEASGSAMPLVWAHSEYIKLRHSLQDGKIFDMPAQTFERYIEQKTETITTSWRFNHKCQSIPAGNTLRIELLSPGIVQWSANGWKDAQDKKTSDTGLGVHFADLPSKDLAPETEITFTIYWIDQDCWEGTDYHVRTEKESIL
jgi:glucoamylase